MEDIYKQLGQIKLVPVVKISEPEKALYLAKALRRGGLPCAEITFRAKDAELFIKKITMAYPDMLIGAGTVLTVKQVDEAVQAGAKFIVSPGFNPEVVEYCVNNGIVIIPGCSNPSDIERAISFGLPVVKFFPAENLGGLSMIKALSAPYSQTLFMPTGGIHMENLCEYLRCKKVIACGGSWMVKEEMIQNNEFDKITELCAKAVKCIKRMEENTGIPEKSYSLKNSASGKKYDVVSLGELLLRLSPAENERISDGRVFLKYPGGAELNVASGLSLLGLKSGMISRLPENSLADYMRARVREKGVSDEYIIRDQSPGARLGIYYCEPALSPRKPSVVYDRKHTSMTGFRSEEVPDSAINQAKLFFTSSITLAVAGFNYGEVLQVIERFRTAGAAIAFDVNYRASLWTEEQARQVIQKVLPLTDILFVSEESSRRMFGKSGSLESIMKSYCDEYHISIVAVTQRTVKSPKCHTFGSVIYNAAEDKFYTEAPYENIEVADRIGSGDSFVAGALYGMLHLQDLQKAVQYGNAMCAVKMTTAGDLPNTDLREIQRVIQEHYSNFVASEMDR